MDKNQKQDSGTQRTPNDQRSDVKNPNSPEYKANQDNRADQMNTNNDRTKGGDISGITGKTDQIGGKTDQAGGKFGDGKKPV